MPPNIVLGKMLVWLFGNYGFECIMAAMVLVILCCINKGKL